MRYKSICVIFIFAAHDGRPGVTAVHSTICRWVQKYVPEIEKEWRWRWQRPQSTSWRVDETYVKVRGKWTYLYRAVDKFGNTVNFYLSPTRNAKALSRPGLEGPEG